MNDIKELEEMFDQYRIFGDERDLEMIEVYSDPHGENCTVPVRTSYMYPELINHPRNKEEISIECAEQAIQDLIKHRLVFSKKEAILYRIDVSNPTDFDINNSALITIHGHYEIKEARRTNPVLAQRFVDRLNGNKVLIVAIRDGKISEAEFQERMAKRNAEFAPKPPDNYMKVFSDAIVAHLEKYIGKTKGSLHTETHAMGAPISVHSIPHSEQYKNNVFVTTGMSFLPMRSTRLSEARFAELMIILHPDWPLPQVGVPLGNNENNWPIRELFGLVDYVQKYMQWFDFGHTYGNGNPPMPFASNTLFCGFLFTYPFSSFPAQFSELKIDDFITIEFLQLIPLYREEMDFSITNSAEELLDKFSKNNIPDYIDLKRKNVCEEAMLLDGYHETRGVFCPKCRTVQKDYKPGKKKIKCFFCGFKFKL